MGDFWLQVKHESGLALIVADILGWTLGCGDLASSVIVSAGTMLALVTAPVDTQDSSEKQDWLLIY